MPNQKQFRNPFYVLLLVVGVAFVITACAYAVMAVRGIESPPAGETASVSGQQFMEFLDRYGFQLLLGELAALGVATFGAIATDQYWMRRETTQHEDADE